MDHNTLRGHVVEYFQDKPPWSLRGLFQHLEARFRQDLCEPDGASGGRLRDEVSLRVHEIVHELIRAGIVALDLTWFRVGSRDEAIETLRKRALQRIFEVYLRVTDHGQKVLAGDVEAVWDPTGFLLDLKKKVRGMHRLELSYLEESVRAYHACLYRASLVMLGGASEALVTRVIRETASALPDGDAIRNKLEKAISTGFGAWRRSVEQNMPPSGRKTEWLRGIDHTFEIIRRCRNEASHPEAVETDRLELQTLLVAFRRYARSLLTLARHLRRP